MTGETVTENTSFTWCTADDARSTVVWLHNYWTEAYRVERPLLSATLLDSSGAPVKQWDFVLEPNSTIGIDIRDVCRDAGRELPFEGQLLLRTSHQNLFPGRPLQVFAEYVQDNGEATGVHGQYGLMRTPAAQLIGTMRVEAGEDRRTAVVLTNPYVGPGGPQPMRAKLTVINAEMQKRTARLAPVPSMGTRRVYLDEVVPDLAGFLHEKPGHFFLKLPCPHSRVANFIDYSDGVRVANHGTIDRTFDQGPGAPSEWRDSKPVASLMVRCGPNRDTVLSFSNNWGPIAADYQVTTTVYDLRGAVIATDVRTVPHLGFDHLAMGELLRKSGQEDVTAAHAEVTVRPSTDVAEWPAQFDVLLGQYRAGRLVAEVQVGAEFINGAVPPGVRLADIRTTRTFGRVQVGDGRRSLIFLAHPSGSITPYDIVAQPLLTLVNKAGTRTAACEGPELPPHAGIFVDIEEMFPEAREILGSDGAGTIKIRDTRARLFGYYTTETDGASTAPLCHLIGG